jgi:hypothetical protein
MARQYVIATGTVALAATVAKTVIEIPTSSTATLQVIGLECVFDTVTAGSCVVEWGTYATTGTGTTVTPLLYGVDQGPAADVGTVKINDSAEPASFARGSLPSWVLPLPGMYSILYPYSRELYQPVSTLRALRMTSVGATNVFVNLTIEL